MEEQLIQRNSKVVIKKTVKIARKKARKGKHSNLIIFLQNLPKLNAAIVKHDQFEQQFVEWSEANKTMIGGCEGDIINTKLAIFLIKMTSSKIDLTKLIDE